MDYLEAAKNELDSPLVTAQAPGVNRALAYAVVALVEALTTEKPVTVTKKSS